MEKKILTLIAESDYAPKAIDVYKKLGGVYFWSDLKEKDKTSIFPKVNILVLRLALRVDKELIDKMPALKVIATSTTGLEHIDTAYAEKRRIKLISLRGHTAFLEKIPSTAEETIGLMISLMRNLPWAFEDVKSGRWNNNRWVGRQLLGKTLGILGFGRLGKIVAGYAKAFGMNVVACDPHVSEKNMKARGVEKVDMETLFKNSDIVSLHVLLHDDTYNLVKVKHLKMMKTSAYLVNTARGELLEKGALLKALKNKWIAGAAVDVLWDERSDGSHLKHDGLRQYAKNQSNLIIVPHIGGTTYEAKEITQEFIAELVQKYIESGK